MADLHGVLGVRLKDSYGVSTSHDFLAKVADTVTLAQLVTDAQAYFALLDPVTDAMGVQGHFTVNFASTGLKTSVAVVNTLGKGGLFTFDAAGTPYNTSILIPALAEAVKSGGKIDLGDADVLAWTAWIVSGGTYLFPESRGYQDLTEFLRCKYVSRSHRRAEGSMSVAIPES